MAKISRRSFLKLVADGLLAFSGLLGLGGLLRFLSYKPEPPPPARFEVGAPDDFLPESRTVLPAIPAILIRRKNTFRAYSLVCTHLGCTVQVNSEEYICPCHGSRYDEDGLVTKSPASSPLQELRVEQTADGKLVIYKDRS
jgi:cytochrome b6-f complex iron-sulfur subunit